jgi:NADP-dependent 3-hydroxy acid dehydrogenase YdfG
VKRVAVVSGASAGIGRATALEFARQGFAVAVLARDADRLESLRSEIASRDGQALAITADVADAEQVESAAQRIEAELGPIDCWVNNAASSVFTRFETIAATEYARVTAVTYLGTVNGTRAALARMRVRNRGCIVQVGSALAYRSIPLQSAYCGAKAAVRGFTDSVRSELIHSGSRVRIAMIQLSAFNTPQFDWARSYLPRQLQPVPPIFQPELAARAIVWLTQHPRRELWVGWPAAKAILFSRIAGALGDRIAARQAWDSQQTSEPAVPRADNLFECVPGPFGAHGRFDTRSRASSPQLWLTMHRGPVALFVAVFLLVMSYWIVWR